MKAHGVVWEQYPHELYKSALTLAREKKKNGEYLKGQKSVSALVKYGVES